MLTDMKLASSPVLDARAPNMGRGFYWAAGGSLLVEFRKATSRISITGIVTNGVVAIVGV